LAAVELLIQQHAGAQPQPDCLHSQLASHDAKRLRAAILLLCGRIGTRHSEEQLIDAAAAIQLVHEATLYPHDIADRAATRRGRDSTQRAFGGGGAALGGSGLLYVAASLCAHFPGVVRLEFAEAAKMLCRGQTRELESTGDIDLSIRGRLEIVLEKTASLF